MSPAQLRVFFHRHTAVFTWTWRRLGKCAQLTWDGSRHVADQHVALPFPFGRRRRWPQRVPVSHEKTVAGGVVTRMARLLMNPNRTTGLDAQNEPSAVRRNRRMHTMATPTVSMPKKC